MNYFRKLVFMAEEKNRKSSTSSKSDSPVVEIKIFGYSLDFAASLTFAKDRHMVPKIIRDCILYINENGLQHIGLYRESGTSSKVKMLMIAYEDRIFKNVELSSFSIGINEVSSLLKNYLRNINPAIISSDIIARLDQSIKLYESNGQSIIKLFRYYLLILPHSTFATLGWLMRHLSLVISNSNVNMMSLKNIIIIFSPCLSIQANILSKLILFSDKIFHEDELTASFSQKSILEMRIKYLSPIDLEKYIDNELITKTATSHLIESFLQFKKFAEVSSILTECIRECENRINILNIMKLEQNQRKPPIEEFSKISLIPQQTPKENNPLYPPDFKIDKISMKKFSSVDTSDFKIPNNKSYHLFTSKMRSKYGILRHTFAPSFSNSYECLSSEKLRHRSNISNRSRLFDDVSAT